jgi:hypothetical protein
MGRLAVPLPAPCKLAPAACHDKVAQAASLASLKPGLAGHCHSMAWHEAPYPGLALSREGADRHFAHAICKVIYMSRFQTPLVPVFPRASAFSLLGRDCNVYTASW